MLTVVGVSAFMLLGPFYTQVLGGSTQGKILRPWVMFHSRGSDMCAVTFTLRSADGAERRIDYLRELGYGSWRTSKKKYKRINSKGEAQRLARKLCRHLEREGSVDLRLHLKCASEDGWEPIYLGEKNACRQ